MFRIDNTSAVGTLPVPPPVGLPGYFTDGNPALAIAATIVDAWWANALQEEILAVVEAAGITPRKTNNAQLPEALNGLYAEKSGYLALTGGTLVSESESHRLYYASASLLMRSCVEAI